MVLLNRHFHFERFLNGRLAILSAAVILLRGADFCRHIADEFVESGGRMGEFVVLALIAVLMLIAVLPQRERIDPD